VASIEVGRFSWDLSIFEHFLRNVLGGAIKQRFMAPPSPFALGSRRNVGRSYYWYCYKPMVTWDRRTTRNKFFGAPETSEWPMRSHFSPENHDLIVKFQVTHDFLGKNEISLATQMFQVLQKSCYELCVDPK